MEQQVQITITPVVGGFIVTYPVRAGGVTTHVQEISTSVGKAMRIARAAVEAFSKVKTADKEETV